MTLTPTTLKPARALLITLLALSSATALAQQQAPPRRGGGGGRTDDKSTGFKENPKMLAAFREVVARPGRSVARVRCDGKDVALATVVGADGWVITKNSELLPGVTPMVVLRDGRTFAAKVTGVDNKFDLAMLKIEATKLTPVEWADPKATPAGELLAAPGTGDEPAAVGVLSVPARAVKARDLPPSMPPANSGFLGVGLEEAEGGARIFNIVPNSAAAKAGLREGDVVTLIAEVPVIDSETMVNTIQHHKPGDSVAIKLKRAEKELEVKATLEKRPPEMAVKRDFQNNLGSVLSDRRGGFPQILQHDMILRPSDCGGPVVNLDGKALGINIARAGRVESYAIPADAVKALIPDLQSGKLAPKKNEELAIAKPPTTKPATRPATAPAAPTAK